MPTLIATPGSNQANAYLTEAEATLLLDERLNIEPWPTTSVPDRERALIWSTRLIDVSFTWPGYATYYDQQVLAWPRYSTYDQDNREWDRLTVPLPIRRAVADLALELLKKDRSAEPELLGLGFSRAKVGPLEVTIDPNQVVEFIPRYIVDTLAIFGPLKVASKGNMRTMKVLRT